MSALPRRQRHGHCCDTRTRTFIVTGSQYSSALASICLKNPLTAQPGTPVAAFSVVLYRHKGKSDDAGLRMFYPGTFALIIMRRSNAHPHCSLVRQALGPACQTAWQLSFPGHLPLLWQRYAHEVFPSASV